MGQPNPVIPVIVCHHVGRDLLSRCLASVRASRGVIPKIIVVTSDPTYVGEEDVHQYFLEDGPAAKRNLAMTYLREPYAVFLDDDVEVSPYALYECWKWMEEHPQCGMVFGKIYKMEEGRRNEFDAAGSWLTWTGFLWDRAGNGSIDCGQFEIARRILSAKSATCGVRVAAFRAVGGFDPAYYILGEETDLSWRLWLQGWDNWYVPTVVSWHAFGCESLKPKQRYYTDERIFYRGCKNYLSLLWTNLGAARLCATLPCHVSAWVVSALGFAARGEIRRSRCIMQALFDTLRSLPTLQRKRHRVQSLRTVADRDLWPRISYTPPARYYWKRLGRYLTQGLHG